MSKIMYILAYTRSMFDIINWLKYRDKYILGLHIIEILCFLGAFAKLRETTISFVMPACLFAPWKKSTYTGGIIIKSEILGFFGNPMKKIQFLLKSDKNNWHFT